MQIINLSIDCSLITKDKIKEVKKKDGTIGKYLNVTVFLKEELDAYGNNASICISQTKEERESKEKTIYLGNGKTTGGTKPNEPKKEKTITNSDLPF